MSMFSKHVLPKLIPLARKVNAVSATLGKPHIHEWDRGHAIVGAGAPRVRQTCKLCPETRIIRLT